MSLIKDMILLNIVFSYLPGVYIGDVLNAILEYHFRHKRGVTVGTHSPY
jgi:hypothetical protein